MHTRTHAQTHAPAHAQTSIARARMRTRMHAQTHAQAHACARTHCTRIPRALHAHCTQVRTVTMGGGFDMHSMAWDEFTRADFVHAF